MSQDERKNDDCPRRAGYGRPKLFRIHQQRHGRDFEYFCGPRPPGQTRGTRKSGMGMGVGTKLRNGGHEAEGVQSLLVRGG
jgi:hypothetical protein